MAGKPLSRPERGFFGRLKRAGIGQTASSPNYIRRLIRPGTPTGEVARGRAKAVSMPSKKLAQEHAAQYFVKGKKVIVPGDEIPAGARVRADKRGNVRITAPDGGARIVPPPTRRPTGPGGTLPERAPRGYYWVNEYYGKGFGTPATHREDAEASARRSRSGQGIPRDHQRMVLIRRSELDEIYRERSRKKRAKEIQRNRLKRQVRAFQRSLRRHGH
jgi:hypothetical protein